MEKGYIYNNKKLLVFAKIGGVFHPNLSGKGYFFSARDQACVSTESPVPGLTRGVPGGLV